MLPGRKPFVWWGQSVNICLLNKLFKCLYTYCANLFCFVLAVQIAAQTIGPQKNDGSPLEIEIVLSQSEPPFTIAFEKQFQVVFSNKSDESITIVNPESLHGCSQLELRFVSSANEESRSARCRQINDQLTRDVLEHIKPQPKFINIPANSKHVFGVKLDDVVFGKSKWIGIPIPSGDTEYRFDVGFTPKKHMLKQGSRNWTKPIRSESLVLRIKFTIVSVGRFIENGFPELAIDMMKADPKLILSRDSYSRTPLHIAARSGDVDVVGWLVENGSDVNSLAYNDRTPLHLSTHPQIVELILQNNPDLNLKSLEQTAFQSAVENLIHANDNSKEKEKWQQIVDLYVEHGAKHDVLTTIQLGDLNQLKRLLSDAPEFANEYESHNPLRVAAQFGRTDICKYLIDTFHVDVDDRESGSGIPIIVDALGNPEVVRLLIDSGADLDSQISLSGVSVSGSAEVLENASILHYAVTTSMPETVDLLIERGVDFLPTANYVTDNRRFTAFDIAAKSGNFKNLSVLVNHSKFKTVAPEVRKKLLSKSLCVGASHPRIAGLLLEKGADPNAQCDGFSVMQLAVSKLFDDSDANMITTKEVVSVLTEFGASIDIYSAAGIGNESKVASILKNNPATEVDVFGPNGLAPIHCAVVMNDVEIVKQLLNAGCDVDIRDLEHTETALHLASYHRRSEIAKVLLDSGANVNVLDKHGRTPVFSAVKNGDAKLTSLFLERGASPIVEDKYGDSPRSWCQRLPPIPQKNIQKLLDKYTIKNESN